MSVSSSRHTFRVGWDVGGWDCDKNRDSRDAVVILNEALTVVGKPWRGNLRDVINTANSTLEFLSRIFRLCGAVSANPSAHVTLAIDTPLGFSEPLQRLMTQRQPAGLIDSSATNPYLFRQTELFLCRKGFSPLSAVKDMIGSQATKGMHVLARFAPNATGCGVWSDGDCLTAIETYPAPCRRSPLVQQMRAPFEGAFAGRHDDERDALTCALIAALHSSRADVLMPPPPEVPASEGWIWLPKDALEGGA
jgi:hypothetical protein